MQNLHIVAELLKKLEESFKRSAMKRRQIPLPFKKNDRF